MSANSKLTLQPLKTFNPPLFRESKRLSLSLSQLVQTDGFLTISQCLINKAARSKKYLLSFRDSNSCLQMPTLMFCLFIEKLY